MLYDIDRFGIIKAFSKRWDFSMEVTNHRIQDQYCNDRLDIW